MAVSVWKEAGFFMIFYLAALQQISPDLAEAAATEAAGRWHIFRRSTFTLLMPTTVFVLVNAVINVFRFVAVLVVFPLGATPIPSTSCICSNITIAFQLRHSREHTP